MRRVLCLLAVVSLFGCPGPSPMDGGMGGGGRAGGSGGGSGGMGGGRAGGAGGGFVMPKLDGGWCELPGTWARGDAGNYYEVAKLDGGRSGLNWLTLPPGFCVHPFANVGNVRQIRFAPGGELFAASPTQGTTSGGPMGRAAIVLMPDDDGDGLADTVITWRSGLPATQGLMFHDGGLWFQDRTKIMAEPYAPGQRAPTGTPQQKVDVQVHVDFGHWPKTLDVSDDGTVFVTNGGFQGETCDPARPFRGGILSIDGSAGGKLIARGLRNPIYLRCHHDGNNRCFANELAKDYSAAQGGREKLIPVREGDDWGYPCCAAANLPYTDECLACSAATEAPNMSTTYCQGLSRCSPKCDMTVAENASFIIGDTPFGLDFMDTQFPAPWGNRVYVAVHGAFGTWTGARVVGISFDPATGLPLPGSNLPGADAGAMADFLEGWDDGVHAHGRPADVTVSPDGRLFVANDTNGEIFWVAPLGP